MRGAVSFLGASGRAHESRAALLIRLEPPHWFGEISVFDGSARTHDAHAAEASTLLQVPHERLQAWLQAHPVHWHALALLLTDKLRTAFVAMEELALLPAPQRLARRLVMMAEGYGQWTAEGQSRRVLSISQEQLSLMLAISRQTTNQISKTWRRGTCCACSAAKWKSWTWAHCAPHATETIATCAYAISARGLFDSNNKHTFHFRAK